MTMVIGLISDTHGLVRPSALAALAGSDLIIHAGDIGAFAVIEALREIAPVYAVRGNCDLGPRAGFFSDIEDVEAEGLVIRVIHDVKQLRKDPAEDGIAVVVSGHTHDPRIESRGDVLYVNPGSAGKRRFRLPVTVARLVIDEGVVEATIVLLEEGT